ncbi:ABC transporter permease [Hamadaea tsunoensis]|uniref:ABC transporter permease n=1 Tax=Hamadaea tsunoensis TaxID=53368 RepID=UPI000411B61D|nr:ABC transporter permease [Hamadaea tsunoensis]
MTSIASPQSTQAQAAQAQPVQAEPVADRPQATRAGRRWAARPGLVLASLYVGALVVAVVAPGLLAGDPLRADPLNALAAPSGAHWFGTDYLGRDVLDRVVFGARQSLGIAVGATLVAVVFGVLLGVTAGLAHRYADEALSRGLDAVSAFPLMLLALLIIAIAGTGPGSLVVAIGIAMTPHYARVVRAQTFVVRRAAYVTHAVAFGAGRGRLALRHVVPNVLGPVPVLAVIGLGEAVLIAAGLSFLGLGAQPPAPEWGAMLADGRAYLHAAWWAPVFPGLAVTATILSATVLGRRLQRFFEGRRA